MTDNRTNHKIDYHRREKLCSTCGNMLPFSSFSKQSRNKSGLRSSCKACLQKISGKKPRKPVIFDIDLELKSCSVCDELLPFSRFYNGSKCVGGLSSKCKSCMAIAKGCTPRKVIFLDLEQEVKQCTVCDNILSFSEFTNRYDNKSGKGSTCRACHQKHREANIEEIREVERQSAYRNRVNRRAYNRKYYKEHNDEINKRLRSYRIANKELIKAQSRIYRKRASSKINDRNRRKYATDSRYRLNTLLRNRISSAVRWGYKVGSGVGDLGCSVEYFHKYIESQFYDRDDGTAMTWDHHSFHGFHLHHIKPLSSFDLEDREQFLEAAHYTNQKPMWAEDHKALHAMEACHHTNQQPLWSEDNLSKGDREDWSRW